MINTLVDGTGALIDGLMWVLLLLKWPPPPMLLLLLLLAAVSAAEGGDAITLSWVFVELPGFELSPLLTSSAGEESPWAAGAGRLEDTEKPS